jgi:hypothetical protein
MPKMAFLLAHFALFWPEKPMLGVEKLKKAHVDDPQHNSR